MIRDCGGLRRGEILKLTKSDGDRFRNVIHVRNTKNGKDRFVQINKVARAELLKLVMLAGNHEYLFQNPKTQTYIKDIKRAFQKARTDAGLVNFHFHALRHTFGSRLPAAGGVKEQNLLLRKLMTWMWIQDGRGKFTMVISNSDQKPWKIPYQFP